MHNFGNFQQKECLSCKSIFTPDHPATKYCCKECTRIPNRKATNDWKINNPREYISSKMKTLYGITIEEYESMYQKQNGCCDICEKPVVRLHIDHCHITGKVRGLLCVKCNVSLGGFGDTIEGLKKAIRYLEKTYG